MKRTEYRIASNHACHPLLDRQGKVIGMQSERRMEMNGYSSSKVIDEERRAWKLWASILRQIRETGYTKPWKTYRLTTVEGAQRYLDTIRTHLNQHTQKCR